MYCHPQTVYFVASQFFRVARHVGRLKLGSKPTQFHVRLSIIPLSQQANHVSSGIMRHSVVAFVYLHFCLTRELNSFVELCIMRMAAVNSFARVLNPNGGTYIYIYIYIVPKVDIQLFNIFYFLIEL